MLGALAWLLPGSGCTGSPDGANGTNREVSQQRSRPAESPAAASMPLSVSQTGERATQVDPIDHNDHNAAPPAADAAGAGEGVDDSEPALFRQLDETFGRAGEVRDGVYRLVTPRTDLFVTMDGMDVPAGAFLESDFRFWRCPCGKLLVNGQFVLADYETNDVVDELQSGKLHVVTIAPLLLHEHPRLLMVRFQGEGRAKELAAALKSALSYTGEARSAPAAPLPATDTKVTPRD